MKISSILKRFCFEIIKETKRFENTWQATEDKIDGCFSTDYGEGVDDPEKRNDFDRLRELSRKKS